MMSEIIQKLLTVARLSTDKLEIKMEDINLNKIICESVKLLSSLAKQKGISINISITGLFAIHGDHTLLLELFTNIIENAIKYNVPYGKIEISLKREKNFVITEIKDTGTGIPEKDLNKVFDRFYRVDKSCSKEIGGIGLGLSICQEIVETAWRQDRNKKQVRTRN